MKDIETKRYLLRKVQNKDSKNIYKILSNPKVISNLNMNLHTSLTDTNLLLEDYFKGYTNREKFPFAIVDKKTNEFLGIFLIKLDLYDEDCFEFTIYIDEKYWGNGIYTEILPYMIKYTFENIKTANFRGFVMEHNKASSRVLEKYGFKLEKIFNVSGLKRKNN